MILHRLIHYGSHAFPREIVIDLDALPTVCAVTGPNGAGKSTLLDVCMAPFLGEFAYRPGALSRQFVSKGVIDLAWSQDGVRYRSVLKVDPDLERTEASLFTADGALITGPLIRDYRKKIAELVGPPEWLLASAYAVQNGVGSFLSLPRPMRKQLLSDLLGLQRFVGLEDRAKTRARLAETALATTRARCGDLEARILAGLGLAAAHREAGARLTAASTEATTAQAACRTAQESHDAAQRALDALEPLRTEREALTAQVVALDTKLADLTTRQANNAALLAEVDAIRAAGPEADRLQAILNAAQSAKDAAQTLLRQRDAVRARMALLGKDLDTASRGLADLTRQIDRVAAVPCQGKGKYAACGFLADAQAARAAAPKALDRIQAIQVTLAPLQAEVATWSDAPETSLQEATVALGVTGAALAALRPLLAKTGPLGAAQARLEELQGQGAAVQGERTRLQAQKHDLDDMLAEEMPARRAMVAQVQQALDAAERTLDTAQATVTRLATEVGRLEGQLAGLGAAEAERTALGATVAPLEGDVSDWTWLARAFGPTGLPALLIDQACPELGALATDLLRETWGDQAFSIALVTQRESVAGDRLLETLDVRLTRGGEALDAALLSGGERVLVTEALGLALALFAAGRGGHALGMLLRDEVAAPLDVDRAPAYVSMLRRAAVIGGLRTVLFVSHSERAVAGADAVLEVRDGTVTLG